MQLATRSGDGMTLLDSKADDHRMVSSQSFFTDQTTQGSLEGIQQLYMPPPLIDEKDTHFGQIYPERPYYPNLHESTSDTAERDTTADLSAKSYSQTCGTTTEIVGSSDSQSLNAISVGQRYNNDNEEDKQCDTPCSTAVQSSNRTDEPFFRRVASVLARRKEKLQQLGNVARSNELQGATFRPAVDPKSRQLCEKNLAAEGTKRPLPVYERLHRLSIEKRNAALRRAASTNQLTSSPHSKHGNNRRGSTGSSLPGQAMGSFLERMEMYQAKREERLAQLRNTLDPLTKQTSAAPARGVRATRLYDDYVAKKFEQEVHQTLNKPPKPQLLCPGTKRMMHGRRRTFEDLLEDSERKALELRRLTREQTLKANNAQRINTLPPRKGSIPNLEKVQRDFSRLYNRDVIAARIARRHRDGDERTKEREELELKECTFHPSINPYKPNPQRVRWSVEGIDKYMQRVLMMRRFEMEQREREQQVFGLAAANPSVA